MYKPSILARGSLVALLSALTVSPAEGAPSIGETAPAEARVESVDGKGLTLGALKGQTVVVVYEDKDSGKVNKPFKEDLSRLSVGAATVTPIADVSEYNSWPAKGFVKDAIRDESKKTGITIWCDWDGSFRKALSLPKGTSSVVVIGKSGKVLFAFDGALDESQRKAAIAAISADAG